MWNVMFQKREDELSPGLADGGKENPQGKREMKQKRHVSCQNSASVSIERLHRKCRREVSS
jgi:hypothetical protein